MPPTRFRRQANQYTLHSTAYYFEARKTPRYEHRPEDLLPPYPPSTSNPFSSSTLLKSQFFWLSLYFLFNLSLTLYNKLVLVRFPFPYTLTAIHTLLGTIGGAILVHLRVFRPVRVSLEERFVLFAFSILYTVNIVVSHASLQLVTIAFHQVVRATTPIFTIIFCKLLLGRRSSWAKIISLSPVVVGVALTTYGDYYFTAWGFLLTLLGTILAAFKTIMTNVLQNPPTATRIATFLRFPRLHPLALLYLLSPPAFVQCICLAIYSGEMDRVQDYIAREMTTQKATGLLLNGFLAFGLNVVSFMANKRVGALSMTVAGNIKQVLTILLGVLIFNLTITSTNALGIILTIVGGISYGYVELSETTGRI